MQNQKKAVLRVSLSRCSCIPWECVQHVRLHKRDKIGPIRYSVLYSSVLYCFDLDTAITLLSSACLVH